MPKLVLASQSPRRKELLTAAGFVFTVRTVTVPEIRGADENPVDYVRRLAQMKAEAVGRMDDEVILGADTVVVAGHSVLEKPGDSVDAARMLALLSSHSHQVITGICLVHSGGAIIDHSITRVTFQEMSQAEIDAYVHTGEPMDKAGAYAIQGLASKFVKQVHGCYFNVVGLPVSLVYQYAKKIGLI